MTKAVWLQTPFAYPGRLDTKAVWLPKPFGYKGRLIQRPFGYTGRLVTEIGSLQRPFGNTGHSVTQARCLRVTRRIEQKTFVWGLVATGVIFWVC